MSNIFTRWIDRLCEDRWDRAANEKKIQSDSMRKGLAMVAAGQVGFKENQEIDMNSTGRISFELTPAVGGHILTVTRRNNVRQSPGLNIVGEDSMYQKTTYVLAKEDDLGLRIAKIINLEIFK